MTDLITYSLEHWYIIPIFIILIGLTVFMWIKAIISGQKRKEERDRIIAQLEKEKALRNQFRVLDKSMIDNSDIDDERLIFGVAANVQMSIEKLDNMNEAFLCLDEKKQFIYALNYVFEDSKYERLSDFFRNNGEPLTSVAQKAVCAVVGGEFERIFTSQFSMLDDNNEDISFDAAEVENLDRCYLDFMKNNKDSVLKTVSDYIRINFDSFM